MNTFQYQEDIIAFILLECIYIKQSNNEFIREYVIYEVDKIKS